MAMRIAVALVLSVAGTAAADTFGGFSGVDAPYLVSPDRVCQPLAVKDGAATGEPTCEKAAADVIAKLSIKEPIVQRGTKATFAATASGTTLTVTRKAGDSVVAWKTVDPIGKVVDVYASQYEDRVAVAYTVRKLGKEVTQVVAFELVKTTGRDQPPAKPDPSAPTAPTTATPIDPKLKKVVDAARKAPKAKALAAWQAVLAADADHSEATYRVASLQVKTPGATIAALEKLAKSSRADAIEWLVEARFDSAFAALRADPKFRAAVGLDRKPQTTYERVMGFGGRWEQAGTSCDAPEVRLTFARDRTFKLVVKSTCRGDTMETPFKGTWRLDGDNVTLVVPTKGKQASAKDEAPCTIVPERDEVSLHCTLDRDLEFVVRPTRR